MANSPSRALVVVALVTAGGCRSSSTPAFVIGRPLREYAATLRIEEDGRVSTETLLVQRPFASRVLRGDTEQLTVLGRLASRANSQWTVLEVPPAPAGNDLRPDIALAAATRRHLVQRRGLRTVAGRRCQVYRAAGPVAAGALDPRRPTNARHTDFCVARGAVVVEQTEVEGGDVTRRVRVTRLRTGAGTAPVPPTPADESLAVEHGGGRTRPIDPVARPPFDRFYVLPAPPEGFATAGRFAAVPLGMAGVTSLVADVYVNGADFVIVDQGATNGGQIPFDSGRPTSNVDLGDLGRGDLVLDLRANEVRVRLPDGGFLRVFGTRSPEALIALAKSLRQQPKETP